MPSRCNYNHPTAFLSKKLGCLHRSAIIDGKEENKIDVFIFKTSLIIKLKVNFKFNII